MLQHHRHQQSTRTQHQGYRKKYYSHQHTGLTDAMRIYSHIVYIGSTNFIFGWENVSISVLWINQTIFAPTYIVPLCTHYVYWIILYVHDHHALFVYIFLYEHLSIILQCIVYTQVRMSMRCENWAIFVAFASACAHIIWVDG